MEIIAIILLILIGIKIEVHIFKHYIVPYMKYDCRFSKGEVQEGESLELIETVCNLSYFIMPCFKSEISTSNLLDFGENHCTVDDQTRSLASLFEVSSKERVTRRWHVNTKQRGIFRIKDIIIVSTDLFGMYHDSDIKYVTSELIVIPRPISIEEYINRIQEIQGEQIVRRFILEDPFITAGVRKYHEGDSMGKIHWGLTARNHELMVRNHEATAKESLTILFNNQLYSEQLKEPVRDMKIENGIRVAVGELYRALKAGIPVRLLSNGSIDGTNQSLVTPMRWGESHTHDLLVDLAKLDNQFTEHFDQFLVRYENEVFSPEVIIITPYIDEPMVTFAHNKQMEGIQVSLYVMSYEVDCQYHGSLKIYYLLDYLEKLGESI